MGEGNEERGQEELGASKCKSKRRTSRASRNANRSLIYTIVPSTTSSLILLIDPSTPAPTLAFSASGLKSSPGATIGIPFAKLYVSSSSPFSLYETRLTIRNPASCSK